MHLRLKFGSESLMILMLAQKPTHAVLYCSSDINDSSNKRNFLERNIWYTLRKSPMPATIADQSAVNCAARVILKFLTAMEISDANGQT
jgi:hypothetical protein